MEKPLVRMVKAQRPAVQRESRPASATGAQPASRSGSKHCSKARGQAHCAVSDERGGVLAEASVARPGRFSCELKFDHPGSRLVTLRVHAGQSEFAQTLRLDTLAAAH